MCPIKTLPSQSIIGGINQKHTKNPLIWCVFNHDHIIVLNANSCQKASDLMYYASPEFPYQKSIYCAATAIPYSKEPPTRLSQTHLFSIVLCPATLSSNSFGRYSQDYVTKWHITNCGCRDMPYLVPLRCSPDPQMGNSSVFVMGFEESSDSSVEPHPLVLHIKVRSARLLASLQSMIRFQRCDPGSSLTHRLRSGWVHLSTLVSVSP